MAEGVDQLVPALGRSARVEAVLHGAAELLVGDVLLDELRQALAVRVPGAIAGGCGIRGGPGMEPHESEDQCGSHEGHESDDCRRTPRTMGPVSHARLSVSIDGRHNVATSFPAGFGGAGAPNGVTPLC